MEVRTKIWTSIGLPKEPFYSSAMEILLAVSNKKCIGILTTKFITDIYNILRRSIHNENEVRRLLRILFSLFDVADTFSTDCELALSSTMKDYEDAIMEALTKPGLFWTWLSLQITLSFRHMEEQSSFVRYFYRSATHSSYFLTHLPFFFVYTQCQEISSESLVYT